jgi:hypothetical protein
MIGGMLTIKVHPRVHRRHPDLTDDDVLGAWANCIRSVPRVDKNPNEHIAVGSDGKGRLVEMVGVRLMDGSWIVFHAMTPPTRKTLLELGLADERRK